MLSYTLSDAVENSYDVSEHFLYVVRDEDVVFYVGQSNNPLQRLMQHLGYDRPWMPDALGRTIRENRPACAKWTLDLYTLEDCIEFIQKDMPGSLESYKEDLKDGHPMTIKSLRNCAELAMIDCFAPYLNTLLNRRNRRPLPSKYVKPSIANEGVKLG